MKKRLAITSIFVFCTIHLFTQQSPTPKSPDIKFAKLEHDFGNIVINKHVTFDFIFANIGKSPIEIYSCTSSSGSVTPTFTPDPILPGKKEKIAVKFYPTKPGLFYKTITVAYSAGTEANVVTLAIKGTIVEE